MDVSIILVNYNKKELTLRCIDSIYKHTSSVTFEIIVVDNASVDDECKCFSTDKRIKYIRNDKNVGFGIANNIGIAASTGNYIFILNNDTLLINDAIDRLYIYANNAYNKDCIYGTWLINSKLNPCHSCGKFPTILSELKIAVNTYLHCFKIKNVEKRDDKITEVEYITGADLFIPRYIIDKTGMFDPDFFMYYEDVDLQWRMKALGIKRIIINGPLIIHDWGSSYMKNGTTRTMRQLCNFTYGKFLYIKKHNNNISYIFFRIAYFILKFIPAVFDNFSIKEKRQYLKLLIKPI